MGGKKGLPSAKEKEEAKAKERNSKAAALKEDAEWEAAGDSHDRLMIFLLHLLILRNHLRA